MDRTSATMSENATTNMDVSRLSRRWALKTGIGALVCLGVGVWGYVDATMVYPKRGYRAAEQFEQSYLEAMRESGRGLERASVDDPVGKFGELSKAKAEGGKLGTADETLHAWLESLKLVSKLGPENTKIPRKDFRSGGEVRTAAERLDALSKIKGGKVSPLSAWDIPSQWLIMVVFLAFGAWLGALFVRVAGRKYRWEAGTQTLTLPGGQKVTPGDVAEFDKRKWDKFLVTLAIKESHPTLGGQRVVVDLYRHEPVEEWILAMERTASAEAAEPKVEGGRAEESGSGTQ